MNIVSAKLHILRIPFKNKFRHSLNTRSYSDSIILEIRTEKGEIGFGEAVPRPYVTGETIESSVGQIKRTLKTLAKATSLHSLNEEVDPETAMSAIGALLPETSDESVIAYNASRAAVEIAVIDAFLKNSANHCARMLPPVRKSLIYSAVISASSVAETASLAKKCLAYGIEHLKIKVGFENDYERIVTVREILGNSCSLRVDANCAFDIKGALDLAASIQKLNIDSFEQPIPRGNIADLKRLKQDSPIAIMVDESLITVRDAIELIEEDACNLFNLRISKNGGINPTIRLAKLARMGGIGFQLGCQVGETAILSAAGRHVAAHLGDTKYIEGSYGELLLDTDISAKPIQFAYGGKALLLKGIGLGVDISQIAIEKHAEKTICINLD